MPILIGSCVERLGRRAAHTSAHVTVIDLTLPDAVPEWIICIDLHALGSSFGTLGPSRTLGCDRGGLDSFRSRKGQAGP